MTPTLGEGFVLGVGVPIVLAIFWKVVLPSIRRRITWIRETPQRMKKLLASIIYEVVDELIAPIKKELEVDHGNSVKDLVLAMKSNQAEILALINTQAALEWSLRGIDRKEGASFVTNDKGLLVHISRQVQWWTGRGEEELLGNRWMSIIWPQDREAVGNWWEATWTGASYGEMEQRYIRYDQQPFRVRIIAEPVNVNGKYIGHVGEIIPLDVWAGNPNEAWTLPERN